MKIRERIQRFFEMREKKKDIKQGGIFSNLIYQNNHLDLIYQASKLCYDRESASATYEQKEKYIANRIKEGHESILEHSNIVTYYEFSLALLPELAEVLTHCLHLKTKVNIAGNDVSLLIGGSIRGYKHIIRNISNQDNKLAQTILSLIGISLNNCYFGDFIEAGIMHDKIYTSFLQDDKGALNISKNNIEIKSIDNIEYIHQAVNYMFTINDLLDICTVTIKFKELSRIISQQLTRHRNGITQLSQRYVAADKFTFNSPDQFKPDKYNKDDLYSIKLTDKNGKLVELNLTLQDLGQAMMSVTPQLAAQGLVKEDSRAYQLNNCTTELYVTFTFRNLLSFLFLRTDSAAQAEIQTYARDIEELFKSQVSNILGDDIYEYLTPMYELWDTVIESFDNIEEVISEETETI